MCCVGLRWMFSCVVPCPIVLSLVVLCWVALYIYICGVVSDCLEFGCGVLRGFVLCWVEYSK